MKKKLICKKNYLEEFIKGNTYKYHKEISDDIVIFYVINEFDLITTISNPLFLKDKFYTITELRKEKIKKLNSWIKD